MRAPAGSAPSARRRSSGRLRWFVALVVLLVALPAVAVSATVAQRGRDDRTGRAGDGSTSPRLVDRTGGNPDLDTPTMPPECFGPAQTGGEPFPCHLGYYKAGRPVLLLWGDSHAYMNIPALQRATSGQGVNLISFVAGSCPPVALNAPPSQGYSGKCEVSNARALAYVKKVRSQHTGLRVVLGSNWGGYRIAYRRLFLAGVVDVSEYNDYTRKMVRLAHEGTPRLFRTLGRLGVDTTVVAQNATVPLRRPGCADGEAPYRCDVPRWRGIPEEWNVRSFLRAQMSHLRGRTRLVDETRGYCTTAVCHGLQGGIETWYDDLHLSATRTRNLADRFADTVRLTRRSGSRR